MLFKINKYKIKDYLRKLFSTIYFGSRGITAENERLRLLLAESRQKQEEILISYKIKPSTKKLYEKPPSISELGNGYLNEDLNSYIISKSEKWLDELTISKFVMPQHLVAIHFVLNLISSKLLRPITVVDFGGGAPTVPFLINQMQINVIKKYKIIENVSFLSKVPIKWNRYAEYLEKFENSDTDLLIISSVLPYISNEIEAKLFESISINLPKYIYFGRTAFLDEEYPSDSVYTIQESIFKDHGPQVEIDSINIDSKVAKYVRRHHKRSVIENRLKKLGYFRLISMADDSGLENIEGLGLYSDNVVWQRLEE